MSTRQKVTILIPCFNEEAGIGSVIDRVPYAALKANNYDVEVLVIDNNSKDNTAKVAEAHGARVLFEGKKGKGNALRSGFAAISADTDFVVMIDGDDTYRAEEMIRLLEPLQSGFCTVTVGSRLRGRISEGSMSPVNRFGNYFFTFMFQLLFRAQATDVLTGMYAWKISAVHNMLPHLTSEGFTIEIEMITKMARLKESIFSVPISYDVRSGHSNLKPFSDGSKILMVLLKNFFWQPRREDAADMLSNDAYVLN